MKILAIVFLSTLALSQQPITITTKNAAIAATTNFSSGLPVSVQFTIDGVNFGPLFTSGPYSLTWDTTKVKNGPHTLSAKATDSAGNKATASPVTVTVSNPAPPTGLTNSVQ